MRVAIIALCATIALASCSTPVLDSPVLPLDDAWRETASYDARLDPPGGYWKTPSEFEADGGGDCEDFATYFLYLLSPDTTARLGVIYLSDRGLFHAIVVLDDGTMIEPQIYGAKWSGGRVIYSMSYAQVMREAYRGKEYPKDMGPCGEPEKITLDIPEAGLYDVSIREIIAACE